MKKINKSIVILSSVAIVALLSGCGDDTATDTDTVSTGLVDPIVAYTIETSDVYNGMTYSRKLGADGDFKAIDGNYGPELAFEDNVTTPYTVNTLTMVESGEVENEGGTISYTTTSDFLEGTEHIQGTSSLYGAFDCETTYTSPIPMLIYSVNDLPSYFDDNTRSDSTCPTWMTDLDYTTPTSFTSVRNGTVNSTSHISEYESF